MIHLEIYNFNELEAPYIDEVRKIIQSKKDYYEQLFKKYPKDLLLEVKFNKDKEYRVSIGINMQSKDIRIVETGRDPVAALRRAFAEFKKTVKRQLAHERKDYLYKRKRYRQQKWKNQFELLVSEMQDEKQQEAKPRYAKKVKNSLQAVRKYLKTRLKTLGLTKKQIKAQLPALVEAVEKRFYAVFDPKQHGPEDLDALLFGIAEELLSTFEQTGAEAEGEEHIDEFAGDAEAPQAPGNEVEEMYFAEDVLDNQALIDKVNEQMEAGKVDEIITGLMREDDRNDQAVYQLYFLEQFTPEEIAGALGGNANEIRRKIEAFRQRAEDEFRKQTA